MLKSGLIWRGMLLAAALMVSTPPVHAHEASKGDLTITHPAARPNLPNRPTAAYMAITNNGATADRLVSASSPAFGAVEIHRSMKQGDVMRMMPVDAVEIPAGDTALLGPGSFHLMLFDGAKLFKVGDEFMMTLTFEQAGEIMVNVKIEKISGGMDHSTHGGHEGGYSGHSETKN